MRNAFRRIAGPLCALPLLAAALLAGCRGDSDTVTDPAAPITRPSLAISDARNGADPRFYFIPPIAAALAAYPGTFDAAESPTISVCVWNGAACVGPPVAAFSRAGGTIAVDVPNQLYRADWTTTGLAAGVLHRIRVFDGAGVPLGFADAKVPGPGETAAGLTAQGIVPLGNASRLAIRFRIQRLPLQNQRPTVTITGPPDNSIVPPGTRVTLTGTATDPEQGDISSQIVWRSNRVIGDLGTGPSLAVTLAGGRHTVSASVTDAGGLTDTKSIQIVVSIVTLPPSLNVPYGGTQSLPITLSEPAPAGGVTFTVTSGAPGSVGVEPGSETVTIPAGLQAASATLRGVAPGTATVTVSNPDYGSASSQVSTTANLNIVEASTTFPAGRTANVTVALQSQGANIAAPAGGLAVTLVSSDPTCVAVGSPVTIPAGLVTVAVTLSYGGSAAVPCNATVTASVPGIPAISGDQVAVTVSPSPLVSLNVGGATVGSGLVYGSYTVTLAAPAPVGGVDVTLVSSNPGLLHLSASETGVGAGTVVLHVGQGQSSATFYIQGVENQTGTATVTASAPGYTGVTSTNVTVRPAIIDIIGLPADLPSTAPDDPFQARVGVANAALNGIFIEQPARAGNPIAVNVTNSDAAVGQLVFNGSVGQSGTVTIAVGQARSPISVATNGVAFRPRGGGVTTVAAASAQTLEAPGATQTVTVTAPTLTTNVGGATVGSGLVYGQYVVTLQTAAPVGGVDVTITSSNGGLLQLSGTETGAGAGSIVVHLNQGQSSAPFWIQGVESQTGTATISASAPGYTGVTSTNVTVRPAIIDIIGLDVSTTTLSPDDPFQVRLGVANATLNAVFIEQSARAGNPITVNLTNGNAAVGQLVFSGGSAQSGTVTIAVGQARSAATVVAGGVAFDPLGSGTTTVTATSPQTLAATGATQVVTVSPPGITLNVGSAVVGSGLVYGAYSVTLGAPAGPGGVSVTLTSSAPTVLQLSALQGDVGAGSIVRQINQGQSSATFYIQGVENQTGTVTVTASAPGYTNGTGSVNVVPAIIDIIALAPSIAVSAADDLFQVRVGASNAAGTAVQAEQPVRAGHSLVATVSNSNPAVGRLAFAGGPAQSGTVTIVALSARSPGTVPTGGVAFDPLAVGSTTVSAVSAAALSALAATQAVTVTP